MSLALTPPAAPVERPRPPADAPADPPQLLWPSISYTNRGIDTDDRTSFPEEQDIRTRHDKEVPQIPLEAFQLAVLLAEVRVLVLDPHFDKVGVDALTPVLGANRSVRDVRLLTGTGDTAAEYREEARRNLTQSINVDRTQPGDLVDVAWRAALDKSRYPFLHDRFAIVDGALWHFGSTVGGGSRGLTAASGPWPASDTRAIDFFDECWSRHA